MIAAASAAADDTMYRECIVSTNASNCRVVKVLFDTGSTPYNYVREEIAAWIEEEERRLPSECYLSTEERRQSTAVNLAGSDTHTVVSRKNVVFNLLFLNEIKQSLELLSCLIARTIPTSIDIIIGLPTIRKYDLVLKIPSHFTSNETTNRFTGIFPGTSCTPAGVNLFGIGNRPAGDSKLCTTCCPPSESNKTHSELYALSELNSEIFSKFRGQSSVHDEDSPQEGVTSTNDPLVWKRELREVDDVVQIPVDNYQDATLAMIKHRSEIIESVDDDDEIEWTEDPFDHKTQPASEDSAMIDLIRIEGPPSLQHKLRALCEEYVDIFATAVRAEAADLPPMLIKVDETKWKSNKHRLPPRTHSVEKQSQIREQCDKLLDLGVIRHSTASEWSQVHMVPKPTPGEWRFTLDFVRLNACTSDLEGWPITLIRPLFQRLGARKPKYF